MLVCGGGTRAGSSCRWDIKNPLHGHPRGSRSSSRGKRRGGRGEAPSPGPVLKRSRSNTSPPAAAQLARLILGSPAQPGSFLLKKLSSPHELQAEPWAGRRSCCQVPGGRCDPLPKSGASPTLAGPFQLPPAAGWALARLWF